MKKHYKSVFEDEQELLKAILEMHCDGADTFNIDPFYFKGNFYKDIPRPEWCSDLDPKFDFVIKEDVTQLWSNPAIAECSAESIILDPPFMIGNRKTQKQYYSSKTHTIFPTLDDLIYCYHGALKSANYALKKNGICVFKCQDYTDSKTTMTHCLVKDLAERWGFYAKDLAILVKPNKIYNPKTKQRHFRKIHTYFWIFQKKKNFSEVDY